MGRPFFFFIFLDVKVMASDGLVHREDIQQLG